MRAEPVAEKSHPVPRDLKTAGRKLWRSTVDAYVLEEHELGLLREACRTADALDALQAVVAADGVLDESPHGQRAHPALVELRLQRVCFARLVAQLGMPTGGQDADAPSAAKQQRRSTRGVYGITGGGVVRRREPERTDWTAQLMDSTRWPQCPRWDRGTQACVCWWSEQQQQWLDAGNAWPGGEGRVLTDLLEMQRRHACRQPWDQTAV